MLGEICWVERSVIWVTSHAPRIFFSLKLHSALIFTLLWSEVVKPLSRAVV